MWTVSWAHSVTKLNLYKIIINKCFVLIQSIKSYSTNPHDAFKTLVIYFVVLLQNIEYFFFRWTVSWALSTTRWSCTPSRSTRRLQPTCLSPTAPRSRAGCGTEPSVVRLFHYVQSNLCWAATQGKHRKWLLRAGGCLAEVSISTKSKFGNVLYWCLRQVGCLIKVTANSGLTVIRNLKL